MAIDRHILEFAVLIEDVLKATPCPLRHFSTETKDRTIYYRFWWNTPQDLEIVVIVSMDDLPILPYGLRVTRGGEYYMYWLDNALVLMKLGSGEQAAYKKAYDLAHKLALDILEQWTQR